MGQAPHAIRRPPCRAAASRFHIPVFHATFVPHAIPRPPHTWATSPYGIAVSPYNHTPDAFPHTFSADPPYDPQALKIRLQIRRDQRVQFHKSQPTLPANIQNLRYNPANQAPAKSSKCYRPATGGGGAVTSCTGMRIPARTVMRTLSWARVRPWSYLHGYVHGYGHARTVTHMHGHSHTFTGYAHGHVNVRARF